MECKCSGKRQKTDHKRDTFISTEEALAKYDAMSIVLSFLGSLRDFWTLIIASKKTARNVFTFMHEQVSKKRDSLPTHGWISFDGISLDPLPWGYHPLVGPVGHPTCPNARNFLFKQLMLQKESTPAFDEAFSDGVNQLEYNNRLPAVVNQLANNNRRLTIYGVRLQEHIGYGIGCGVSDRILLPGKSYRISVEFFFSHLNNRANRFGIIRPIKCSSSTISQMVQKKAIHGSTFGPELETIPSRWKEWSSINAVMWNPYPGSSVSIQRGRRSGSDLQREGGWDSFFQSWRGSWEDENVSSIDAKFELDLEDPSNGKLNFIYLDNDEEQRELITEGLTGEYVWAGSIGVYQLEATWMEIS